jgi:8-oxo-dGTP pyrophosphatase MutT (NUDIX family)
MPRGLAWESRFTLDFERCLGQNKSQRENSLGSIHFSKMRELDPSLQQDFLSWQPEYRVVVAAVCYRRQAKGEIEFLLVRTRAGRWTFPKGGVDGDATGAAAAAREAYEEAGVRGRIEPLAFTWYLHSKKRDEHSVGAHLCEVLRRETPCESYRTPRWFTADKAKQRLREERRSPYAQELERVVDDAVRRISERHS